jgi:CheY-like chemotaxis protein
MEPMVEPIISKRYKILLSNSDELLGSVRETILKTSQVTALISCNRQETVALVQTWRPDLIILGPERVVEECEVLKSSKDYRLIPIIGLIKDNKNEIRSRALSAGCDEWLPTPINESSLLEKVQNLTGIMFRKLPRYIHRGPALVTFKKNEFPSQSVDINRRMIFLESNEGLSPAVGRNVELKFHLTPAEPISCWGRIERLMVRRNYEENNETMGMLIRFLDLPENAARRIDALAIEQLEKSFSGKNPEAEPSFEWLDLESYLNIARALFRGESSKYFEKLTVSQEVLKVYLQGFSTEEKNSLSSDASNGPESLLGQTVAMRLKLMDELVKGQRCGSFPHIHDLLNDTSKISAGIEKELSVSIEKEDSKEILNWAKINYEIIRTLLEIKFIHGHYGERGNRSPSKAQRSLSPWASFNTAATWIVLIISLVLNIILIFFTE